MYAAAKRRAEGKPTSLPRQYRSERKEMVLDVVDVVVRTTQLAHDLGSWEKLEELIRVLRGTAT